MSYAVNKRGFFGRFGGAYIPEMLHPNIEELQQSYNEILQEESFEETFQMLLRDYIGRPTPLYEATRLSEKIGARIFLKREDLNHTGSHKINNAIGQILLAKKLGKTRIIAETGAGQHGVATATACALMNMECFVYMGEIDMNRQAPNVKRMQMLGTTVVPVTSGSKVLKDAANEAMRDWISNPSDTHYIIGSAVGPHPFPDMVARFQSVISKELKEQLQTHIGRPCPDKLLACVGGGSNAIGAFYHYLDEADVELFGIEAAGEGLASGCTAATIATGSEGVLHGSRTLVMQTADGQIEEAHSISAGLDYPGIGPQHAHLHDTGRVSYVSVTDTEAVEAAIELSQLEGIIPALETAHALAYLPKLSCKPEDVVVVNLSGRGDKDMQTYLTYLDKKE
ncbi:MAG: tryptophan synthase subunit beta [Deltaproteobacteria bacterium]|nr:tryptophan synthase subunit beta [Deltaproteobacteria bacterium]MBU49088.1 tryptophan synthase subunit beta [Deltaproteobacteria bacterium]|tara:strand:+ start:3990 stop:5177 length:1188 start_codon:yes stop_codon:yes gene_type:complete